MMVSSSRMTAMAMGEIIVDYLSLVTTFHNQQLIMTRDFSQLSPSVSQFQPDESHFDQLHITNADPLKTTTVLLTDGLTPLICQTLFTHSPYRSRHSDLGLDLLNSFVIDKNQPSDAEL